MKGKNVIALVIAAAVLVAAAVFSSRNDRTRPARPVSDKLLPDFSVNSVEKLVVNSGANTAAVAKVGGTWVMPAKQNYPARFDKVREVLLAMSELKKGQPVRVSDERKKSLKICTPAPDGSGGTLVTMYGANGRPVAELILGEMRERRSGDDTGMGGYPDGRFVSTDGGSTVVLVANTLNDISDSESAWIDADLLNVSGSDIREIRVSGDGREDVILSRSDPSDRIALASVPEGREQNDSNVYSVESAISYLRMNDVADREISDEAAGFDKAVTYRAETFKGEVYTVKIGGSPEGSDERYVRLMAEMLPVPDGQSDPTNDAQRVEFEKNEKERKELAGKISDLNARFSGWTYKIASYNAGSMTKTLEELTKETRADEPSASNGEVKEDAQGGEDIAVTAGEPAPEDDAAAGENAE
ncbi:MAG: DUF4340 domain-containing protein [Lentisphaerae bacterium]|nr:DUF4340 domain-containing protein [Lentisphaerota bacterium]